MPDDTDTDTDTDTAETLAYARWLLQSDYVPLSRATLGYTGIKRAQVESGTVQSNAFGRACKQAQQDLRTAREVVEGKHDGKKWPSRRCLTIWRGRTEA